MTHSLIHNKNAELYEVVIVRIDEAGDVSLLHVLAVELEHSLTIVGFNADAEVVCVSRVFGGVYIDSAYIYG